MAEAGTYFVAKTVIGLTLTVVPQSKIVKVASAASQIAAWFLDANDTLDLDFGGMPRPQANQYHKIESWYANYRLYVKTSVWNNKNAFDSGADPIYVGTANTQIVKP